MNDIYEKLEAVGINREYVKHILLWDWWDDELACVPSTRAQVEFHLSQLLGLKLVTLRHEERKIKINSSAGLRFDNRLRECEQFMELWRELEVLRPIR